MRKIKKRIKSKHSGSEPGAALPSRFGGEQILRDLHKLLDEREFANEEDLKAYLNTLLGDGLEKAMAGRAAPGPQERAQDLAYQAMEAPTPSKAMDLARQALKLDPGCVDALRVTALYTARSRQEYVKNLRRVVEIGERLLGSAFFEENRGRFWGVLETRPYMRTKFDLAYALQDAGRTREAIAEFESILKLNPGDNQGCRDELLGCYLLADDLASAGRLLNDYKEDCSAVFRWGRVLERYLASGAASAAGPLKTARKQNRHVEAYLTGKKPIPLEAPECYSLGDESEAVHCVLHLGPAWLGHPDSLEWLLTA